MSHLVIRTPYISYVVTKVRVFSPYLSVCRCTIQLSYSYIQHSISTVLTSLSSTLQICNNLIDIDPLRALHIRTCIVHIGRCFRPNSAATTGTDLCDSR